MLKCFSVIRSLVCANVHTNVNTMKKSDLAQMKSVACEAIDNAIKSLHDVSASLHANPELGYEEHHAHEILTDYLDNHGFQVQKKHCLDTAFRAVRPSDTDHQLPSIAMICEYDALPDIGHACGHNLIAEVGLGAAVGVKAALDKSDENIGKLLVLGTPAEEGGAGKCRLLDQGVFNDVDIAMMSHPAPATVHTPDSFLCVQSFRVDFHGKASHAAGFPWEGVNALDAACLAYQNVSCLRQQMKPTWRVHGVITNGGTKPNIIPEKASMYYYVRTPKLSELSILNEKVETCMRAAATATGCEIDMHWEPKPRTNIITNKQLVDLYRENAESLGVEFETDPERMSLFTGSTDMGNVSYTVPTIHPLYYIGEDVYNHTKPFTELTGSDKAQPYTITQAKALAMTALDVMCNPALVTVMKQQLQESLKQM